MMNVNIPGSSDSNSHRFLTGNGISPKVHVRDGLTPQPNHARGDKIMGLLVIAVWLVLFWLGLLISSGADREALSKSKHFALFDASFWRVVLTFTPTNLGLICILTSIAGGYAKRLSMSFAAENPKLTQHRADRINHTQFNPISSALRGLVVYLGFLSGLYMLSPDAFKQTTQETYLHSVGAMLVAFGVGYHPESIRHLWQRFGSGNQPPETKANNNHAA
jgi:hypothetical protein